MWKVPWLYCGKYSQSEGIKLCITILLFDIILFHVCNNKNIYQQFYCCLRYIFYT